MNLALFSSLVVVQFYNSVIFTADVNEANSTGNGLSHSILHNALFGCAFILYFESKQFMHTCPPAIAVFIINGGVKHHILILNQVSNTSNGFTWSHSYFLLPEVVK